MRRVQVQLTDDQLDALRRHAAANGEGIATLVREAVDAWISNEERTPQLDRALEDIGFLQPAVPEVSQPSRVSDSRALHDSPAAANLVSVTEIAARAGRSVNTVQSWRRRHRDFPAPTAQLAAGPIWNWPVVSAWISHRPARADAGAAQAAADRGQIRRLLAMSDREREAYFLASNRNMLGLFADTPAGR